MLLNNIKNTEDAAIVKHVSENKCDTWNKKKLE